MVAFTDYLISWTEIVLILNCGERVPHEEEMWEHYKPFPNWDHKRREMDREKAKFFNSETFPAVPRYLL